MMYLNQNVLVLRNALTCTAEELMLSDEVAVGEIVCSSRASHVFSHCMESSFCSPDTHTDRHGHRQTDRHKEEAMAVCAPMAEQSP